MSVEKRAECVEIRVADDGPGIPDAIAGKLFELYATYGKKGGTGLGLATARNLLKAQGGEIWLEPKNPEGGAAFRMKIPFVTPSIKNPALPSD